MNTYLAGTIRGEKLTLSIEKRESHRELMLPKIEGPAHLEELVTKAIS
ncbi:MAG: hypothetical protein AB7W16_28990 [Candidatus Obscuribacterales bacterium]